MTDIRQICSSPEKFASFIDGRKIHSGSLLECLKSIDNKPEVKEYGDDYDPDVLLCQYTGEPLGDCECRDCENERFISYWGDEVRDDLATRVNYD